MQSPSVTMITYKGPAHQGHTGSSQLVTTPPTVGYVPEKIMAEEAEVERERMAQRVAQAVDDPTGRLKLYLNGSHAKQLEDDIGRVKGLRELHCYGSPLLTTLPLEIAKLSNSLKIIKANNCSLESIPEDLSALRCLVHLDLSFNKLTSFFWEADNLSESLEFLNVSHNKIVFYSPGAQKLIHALKDKEKQKAASLLHAPDCLILTPNDYLTPTEHLLKPRFKADCMPFIGGTPDYGDMVGHMLLPDQVENCSVCGKTVYVGRPRAHIVFETIESSVDASDMETMPAPGSGGTPRVPVKIPIVHPVCREPKCSLALHNELAMKKLLEPK